MNNDNMIKDKVIYGVTAIFETPDSIMESTKKVEQSGYKNFDVHTPYPLHGMFQAMKLPPSPLGYFALVLGLTGAFAAFALMTYIMTTNYPMIISGKPFWPIPAFIPVTFEVTVLLASVGSVLGMLFILFKLPNNSHPLHNTEYMKKVSSDKYGICIEAKDEMFDIEKIKEYFSSIGGKEIEVVYYDNETLNFKPNIFDIKFVGFLIIAAVLVSAATYVLLNKLMYVSPFDWMMHQQKIAAQVPSEFFGKDDFSMRMPPNEAVPRGHLPYQFAGNVELAEAELINPILPTEQNLKAGEKKYDIYCSPCHGFHGVGDARLNGHFPNPPSLHSEKARKWKDGMFFHIITEGQNSMPSYSSQLTTEEKWQTVLYIRALQNAMNAIKEDVK